MPRERSAARSAKFGLLLALLLYVLLEGLSWMAYGWLTAEPYSPSKLSHQRRELIAALPVPDTTSPRASLQKYVPHPYLGYVMNPESFQEARDWWIYADSDPFESPTEAVQVVLVGGSVAFNLRRGERLLGSLEQIPAYRDRPLRLVTLAGLGHKEPQQLLAVAYFLSLGGRIDLLINLDGFNEIGSEIDRNLRQDVNPSYPSFWSQVTRGLGSPTELQALGEIVFLRRARASLAETFEYTRWSATANLVWSLADRGLEAAIHVRIGEDLEVATGPPHSRGPAEQACQECAHSPALQRGNRNERPKLERQRVAAARVVGSRRSTRTPKGQTVAFEQNVEGVIARH